MTSKSIANLTFAILTIPVFASAQTHESQFAPPPAQSPPISYHHASTYEEGVLRGWSDVARAIGEKDYNHSVAAMNYEEAARRRLANRRQYVIDYFDLRNLNHAARFANRTPPTPEQLHHWSKDRLPPRLSHTDYHRGSRRLVWPAILKWDMFAHERGAIDELMATTSPEETGLGTDHQQSIKQLANAMETKLKCYAARLGSTERIAARKFLKSLCYEVRFPMHPIAEELTSR